MEPPLPTGAAFRDEAPGRAWRQIGARPRGIPCLAMDPARAAAILFCGACLMLAACALPSKEPEMRIATLIRIERPQGEFFSPRMPGPGRPLTKVYLRPNSGGRPGDAMIVVAVLGPYEPAILGRPGDVVLLTYPGPFQPGREIPFEDLVGYAVISKSGQPRTPI